jgi:hypothetical protein
MSDGPSTAPTLGPHGFINRKLTLDEWKSEFLDYFIEGNMDREYINYIARKRILQNMLDGRYFKFESSTYDFENGVWAYKMSKVEDIYKQRNIRYFISSR